MALTSPVLEHAPEEVAKNLRTKAYFNLDSEWLAMRPKLRSEFTPPAPQSGPDNLERIRPKMWKNQAQIEAMETDHKRIVNSIRRVKRRDEFLGEEVEKFDRHVKVLVQARLYDLYADSELSICASHQAAQPPTSPLLSAFNWFVPSLKCFGLDYLIDTHKYRISETNSLGESSKFITATVTVLDLRTKCLH
ncbi:hypothetical protein PtB15_9B655 [Puccinia triticina]|nr:hypothetical protein PtB15_9B655 [Puccinia triticina]